MKYLDFGNGRLKKKYRRLKILFAIVLILFGLTVFFNIDYFIFKVFISTGYTYTDTLDDIYDQSLGDDNYKSFFLDFDRAVIALFTEKIRTIGGDSYTYLYTPQSYKESKEYTRVDAEQCLIAELDSNTVYVYLPNISKHTRNFIIDNKEELFRYPNMVLDLRSNYGGMLNDYYKIAELFLEKGAVIGYENYRIGFLSHAVESTSEKYFGFSNIIILQNDETASSAEGLIMALKENLSNVVLIGETTFGKGIGQATVPLKGGYAIKATVLTLDTPTGNSIHKNGIMPDFEFACDKPNHTALKSALAVADEQSEQIYPASQAALSALNSQTLQNPQVTQALLEDDIIAVAMYVIKTLQ